MAPPKGSGRGKQQDTQRSTPEAGGPATPKRPSAAKPSSSTAISRATPTSIRHFSTPAGEAPSSGLKQTKLIVILKSPKKGVSLNDDTCSSVSSSPASGVSSRSGQSTRSTPPTPTPPRFTNVVSSSTSLLQPPANFSPPQHIGQPFQRPWIDNTYPHDTHSLHRSIRLADKSVPELPPNYTWYPNAPPIDAIFPPGVPMSGKEVNAYYPHHILWKDISARLLGNGYKVSDILGMQAFFRESPHPLTPAELKKQLLNTHPTTLNIDKYPSSSSTDLRTPLFSPPSTLTTRGAAIPTFTDLIAGLTYLPTGLDARDLTVAIKWWLAHRSAFTPPLEFNVLHTRSLIHALRIPLKGYGKRNLDKIGVVELRSRSKSSASSMGFWSEKRRVEDEVVTREEHEYQRKKEEICGRSGDVVEIKTNSETVRSHVIFPLRHVFTFPFLGVQSMVGEALSMGIKNAEHRREERKAVESTETGGSSPKATSPEKHREAKIQDAAKEIEDAGDRSKKRPLSHMDDAEEAPAKKPASAFEQYMASLKASKLASG